MGDATAEIRPVVEERRWSWRLVCWVAVLVLANRMADTAITTPQMVTFEMLKHFGTDQVAWLNSTALLAGAIWSPLLAKCADIFGKRRVLLITVLVAGAGSLLCFIAPTLWIFLVGRLLQGAAMAVVFLTVALTREFSTPQVAMTAVGFVTSSSAIFGIVEPFLMDPLIARFGFRSVFALAVVLAAAAALYIFRLIPESPVRTGGRIDVGGALLLGGGLAGVLGYTSLGQDLGWLSGSMLALLTAGVAALVGWVFTALRVDNPIVDIRALNRPIRLTLVAVVLAAGAFQAMMTLASVVAKVPTDLGLGYGLGDAGPSAVVFAAPAPGLALGGIIAGWLAARIGPASTLLGGITIGAMGTVVMLAGVSSFPLMIVASALLGVAAGAINTSGFNMAVSQASPRRLSVVSGLVSVMLALGGAVVTVIGTAVLNAFTTVVNGASHNSRTGVYLYIMICGLLFVLAMSAAAMLARKRLVVRSGSTETEAPKWASEPAVDEATLRISPQAAPPLSMDGGIRPPVYRVVVAAAAVFLAGIALFFGARIVAADDGRALLGSQQLTVGPDQQRVEVGALFGDVDVLAPEGVHVLVSGQVVFGGIECERACVETGRAVVVDAVGAFAMIDVMRPGEVLADEREAAREGAEDAVEKVREQAEDAWERAEEAQDGG